MFLKKMKLSACDSYGDIDDNIEPFEMMINPETITIKSSIVYTNQEGCGSGASTLPKYRCQPVKEIVIAPFIIDVTGAVPGTMSCLHASMDEVIAHLEEVVYNITDEDIPPIILIEWGANSYKTQLTTMEVKYTLFDSDGDPLRAEVSLNLQECPEDTRPLFGLSTALEESRYKVVEAGDKLDALCDEMYKDKGGGALYIEDVAKANDLEDYNIVPGQLLYFPPVE